MEAFFKPTSKDSYANFIASTSNSLDVANNIIDNTFYNYYNSLDSIAKNTDLTNKKALIKDLKLIQESDSSIINVYFVDEKTGKFQDVFSSELDADLREVSWYNRTKETKN